MATKDDIKKSMGDLVDMWNDPNYVGDPLALHDWRTGVQKSLKDGDVPGIRRGALPSIQAEVVRLAMDAKSEQTRLSAAQFVLAQEGHGAVTKTEGTIKLERMPVDQLQAIISSRLMDLRKLAPGFRIENLLPSPEFDNSPSQDDLVEVLPDPVDPEFEVE